MLSETLTPRDMGILRDRLIKDGVTEIGAKSRYEAYRFDDREKGVLAIAYKSGKLVYKESGYLEKVLAPITKADDGFDALLGTDEAGKGEWYGPLVVVCAAMDKGQAETLRRLGVKDSMKLGKRRITQLGRDLIASGILIDYEVIPPGDYNRRYSELRKAGKNLNDMLTESHASLVRKMLARVRSEKAKVVIDMFDYKRTKEKLSDLESQKIRIIQKTGGESETAVAAASVVAKYLFEKEVDALEREYHVRLRKSSPKDVPRELLEKVAKTHFRNVEKLLSA